MELINPLMKNKGIWDRLSAIWNCNCNCKSLSIYMPFFLKDRRVISIRFSSRRWQSTERERSEIEIDWGWWAMYLASRHRRVSSFDFLIVGCRPWISYKNRSLWLGSNQSVDTFIYGMKYTTRNPTLLVRTPAILVFGGPFEGSRPAERTHSNLARHDESNVPQQSMWDPQGCPSGPNFALKKPNWFNLPLLISCAWASISSTSQLTLR